MGRNRLWLWDLLWHLVLVLDRRRGLHDRRREEEFRVHALTNVSRAEIGTKTQQTTAVLKPPRLHV